MKALKWFGIAAGVLILFMLILVVTLSARDLQWRSTVKPLTVDELQRPAPHSTLPSHQDTESDRSPDVNEAPSPPPYTAPHPSELAAPPTLEQARRHFQLHPDTGKPKPLSSAQQADYDFEIYAQRVVTSATSSLFGEAVDGFCGNVHGLMGVHYIAQFGDLESARVYLRDGVRRSKTAERRGRFCGELAWLESDTRTAAALLEQSCAAPPINYRMEAWSPCNALTLAVVTGSDELATYYYDRYLDFWDKWREHLFPEVRDWIAAHNAKRPDDTPK